MPNQKPKKPSEAQLRVLRNLAAGRSAAAHCRSMSDYGGLTGTLASLYRNGWLVDNNKVTDAGLLAAGLAPLTAP
jgi:hypothetical protein